MKKKIKNAIKHDRTICLVPGLFRSFKKGERQKEKLDITYFFGDKNVRFRGGEPLGVDDLRVLQALVGMASDFGTKLTSDSKKSHEQNLRALLKLELNSVEEDAIQVTTSYRNILRESGYKNTGNVDLVKECIRRLFSVSISIQSNEKKQCFRMIASCKSQTYANEVDFVLNPLIAKAIFGQVQYSYLSIEEIRNLKSDLSRIIHQRLCSWIDLGKCRVISLNAMAQGIWSNSSHLDRLRRFRSKKAIFELVDLGWKIKEGRQNLFKIKRPQHKILYTKN